MKTRTITIAALVGLAALMRLLPHPWNFSPVAAMALFSGANFEDRRVAFAFPLAALFLSDLVLGLYGSMWIVYGSFALIVGLGLLLGRDRSVTRIGLASVTSSTLFFVLTNFGVWATGHLYPLTGQGLVSCFVAAIPFFQNTLLGDGLYVGVLFGSFALASKMLPALRQPACIL